MEWDVVYEKAIRKDGTLFFPERLTREFLDQARRTMGSYLFANQYQNEVIPEEEKVFKPDWLRYWKELPSPSYRFGFIDPAIGQKEHHDFTGVVIIDVDVNGYWYVRVAQRYKITPTQIISKMFDLHAEFNLMALGVENVAYQEALLYMLDEEMKRRKKIVPVKGITRKAISKQTRILGLAPRFEWGRIYLAPGLTDLEDELASFPRGTYDDVCFIAGTKIATPFGDKNIESLKVGDKVITPNGYAKITHTGNRLAETINKIGLIGTPSHPIITINGLTHLIDCNQQSMLANLTWKYLTHYQLQKLLCLMELNTEEWAGRDGIILLSQKTIKKEKILKGFMSQYMKLLQGLQFQKAFMSIILTAIRLIMIPAIYSVYLLMSTIESLKKWTWLRLEKILTELDHLLLYGIRQKLEKNGTGTTERNAGLIKSLLKLNASFVEELSSAHLKTLSFVAISANGKIQEMRKGISTIENVQSAERYSRSTNGVQLEPAQSLAKSKSILQRVYNLKIENDGVYFANRILVSNCDALASLEEMVFTPQKESTELVKPHSAADPNYEKWLIQQLAKGEQNV